MISHMAFQFDLKPKYFKIHLHFTNQYTGNEQKRCPTTDKSRTKLTILNLDLLYI